MQTPPLNQTITLRRPQDIHLALSISNIADYLLHKRSSRTEEKYKDVFNRLITAELEYMDRYSDNRDLVLEVKRYVEEELVEPFPEMIGDLVLDTDVCISLWHLSESIQESEAALEGYTPPM
jgi:hypothetical protein